MGQTGCSRRPSAQTTERAVREFSAEDVEVGDGKGPVSTRWACCCVELLYVCIHLVMNIHGGGADNISEGIVSESTVTESGSGTALFEGWN
jgi:hypothetical protein